MSIWDLFRRPRRVITPLPAPEPRMPTLTSLAEMTSLGRRQAILLSAIIPAQSWLAARGVRDTLEARIMSLAIAGQESDDFRARRQYKGGPARGFWQFEAGGGVKGVLTHPSSKPHAAALCTWRDVAFTQGAVHPSLELDDILAAGMARLLLFTDPRELPDDGESGFAYYLRNWRPGAWFNEPEGSPKRAELRKKWSRNWALAVQSVTPVVEAGRK